MPFKLQPPAAALTWSWDWDDGGWLAAGDSVQSDAWSIAPSAGVTVTPLTIAGNTTSARVSGLTRGQQYALKCVMTSALGETGVQVVSIRCDFG